EVLLAVDATLVEINPLVLLSDGRVLALDAKVTVDDNALFRQPDIAEWRSTFPVDPTEARAREKGLQYVKLDGEVGIIGNGAGLGRVDLHVPMVVRLDGTNAEEGRRMLQEAGHPKVVVASTMQEAAQKAADLARETA